MGGREESGARKGLDTALAGGQEEETGEVRKGLNGDFFTGAGEGGVGLDCGELRTEREDTVTVSGDVRTARLELGWKGLAGRLVGRGGGTAGLLEDLT